MTEEILNNSINNSTTDEIEFQKIPLKAIRQKCRLILSKLLNPPKILPSEDGLPRDWRGIAYLAGLQSLHGPTITMHPDPMSKVLELWNDVAELGTGSVDNLIQFLGEIDRWDVADDIQDSLVEDARFYLDMKHNQNTTTIQMNFNKLTELKAEIKSDANILTQDDVLRAQQGLPPQEYDGFVIFADEDIDFASELIERMENFGFKLCFKDRDLIGGISFEHEAIMRLISERCNRLIVIVSPAFLESSANKFFVNFAQALGIEQGRRKIIPCLIQHCILPATLSFYFLLNYQRSGRLWNFWDKLRDSIQKTSTETITRTRAITSPTTDYIPITNDLDVVPGATTTLIEYNEKCSSTLPIKIPRKKHHENYVKSLTTTTTSTIPSNVNSKIHCSTSLQFDDNEKTVSQTTSMFNFHDTTTTNAMTADLTNNSYVQINPTNIDKSASTKKWYKKLLSSGGGGNTINTDSADNKQQNGIKERSKKKWYKKKLISS